MSENQTSNNDQPKNKQTYNGVRCPKNMKLPTAVKRMAALMKGTKEERNHFMRSMGVAMHEAQYRTRTVAPIRERKVADDPVV